MRRTECQFRSGAFSLMVGLAILMSLPAKAAANPWAKPKGEGFFQLSYYTIGPYDRLFQDSGGDFRLGREVTDASVEAYLEYGVTDAWTVVGVLPFKATETGDPVSDPTITPPTIAAGTFDRSGNMRVGARRQFVNGKYVLSGQFDVELPTGDFAPETGLSTGYDAYTFTPSVAAGKGWTRAYVYGYLGVDLRTNDFSSSWRTGFEGGYRFFGRLWLIGLLDVVGSFENGDIVLPQANLETGLYVNDQEYVAYGAKALIEITRKIGLQFTYYTAASGNNVASSPLSGFGVFVKW